MAIEKRNWSFLTEEQINSALDRLAKKKGITREQARALIVKKLWE